MCALLRLTACSSSDGCRTGVVDMLTERVHGELTRRARTVIPPPRIISISAFPRAFAAMVSKSLRSAHAEPAAGGWQLDASDVGLLHRRMAGHFAGVAA